IGPLRQAAARRVLLGCAGGLPGRPREGGLLLRRAAEVRAVLHQLVPEPGGGALDTTAQALNDQDPAGEDHAQRADVAKADHDSAEKEEEDSLGLDGKTATKVADLGERPVVLSTHPHDDTRRDYSEKPDPEEPAPVHRGGVAAVLGEHAGQGYAVVP